MPVTIYIPVGGTGAQQKLSTAMFTFFLNIKKSFKLIHQYFPSIYLANQGGTMLPSAMRLFK